MKCTTRAPLAFLLAALTAFAAHAQSESGSNSSSTGFCDRTRQFTAAEQDRLLRFAAAARDELDASGSDTVIISRSGLDLSRFHIRYSHAAVMTRSGGAHGAWTARQLYYACDESRPRIFDQGLPGFAGGSDDPALGYLSIVALPAEPARQLRQAAQSNVDALSLLAATYSANAYPFSTLYQNCNQWVIELLALAWGNLNSTGTDARERAQQWLKQAHYDPEPIAVRSGFLMIASAFTPMLHLNDHPKGDREAMRLQVSLPSTIEAFVQQRLPESRRIELCHTDTEIVVHRGWTPIADGCQPGADDRVIALSD